MTEDQDWGPGSGWDADPGWPPPETFSLESEERVRRGGLGARLLAGVLGVVLLVGGVAFAATQFGGAERTPEEAVTEFLTAVGDEDVLGVLATLDPGERDAMLGPVQDLVAELERLEVLADVDLSSVGGLDIEFSDLAFHTETVHDDLVRVYLTGGTASFAFDTDELPVGDFLTDTFDRFDIEHEGIRDSDTEELGPTLDDFLAVRRGSDGWRVSIGYTIAEAARLDAGAPAPDPAQALAPIGAESPEAAVDGLVRAAVAADVPGIVARLSPAELAALHEYWPLIAGDAELPDLAALGVEIDLRRLDLRSDTDGDRARVFVDGFDLGIAAEGMRLDIDHSDGCTTITGDLAELGMTGLFDGEPICAGDVEAMVEQSLGGFGFEELGIEVPQLDPIRQPEVAVIAQRVDGRWYVAPIGTGADAILQGLRAIDRSHLDAFVDVAEQFADALTASFSRSFSGDVVSGFDQELPFPTTTALGADAGTATAGAALDPSYPDPQTFATLDEMVRMFVTDDGAGCALVAMQRTGNPTLLVELAQAYRDGSEPSPAAQDLLFGSLASCGY